ncbi:MAG: hypothetical protein Q9191_001064 [Dirinaria sp. TL-2023a]
MSQQHSTLELSKHDLTTGFPERDYSAVAPEKARNEYFRDEKVHQASPYLGSEKFFSEGPSELAAVPARNTFSDSEEPTPKNTSLDRDGKIIAVSRRLSRRTLMIMATVIIAVILGAAIGIGVGIGLKKRKTSTSPSTMVNGTPTGVPRSR